MPLWSGGFVAPVSLPIAWCFFGGESNLKYYACDQEGREWFVVEAIV